MNWLTEFVNSINFATQSITSSSITDIQNLTAKLTINLKEELGDDNESPFRIILNSFAKANDSSVKRIEFRKDKIECIILFKYKGAQNKMKNPIKSLKKSA